MKYSHWLWPILLIISAIVVTVLVLADVQSLIRPFLALWFLLVCPGMAIIRLFRFKETSIEWILAVAASLGLDAIIAILMVYTKMWSPAQGLVILAAVTIIGALVQFQMAVAPLAISNWTELRPAHQNAVIALLGGLTTAGVILLYFLVMAGFHFG